VSVVMPAFEEEAFIAEALESALAQTHRPVEVIVVDDGSGDRTAEIAAAHGVRVLRREHQGPAAARNAGLAVAAGDYWTIFDADDLMPRERLAHQVAQLERHPELGMVFGLTRAFVTPGESRPAHFKEIWDRGPFPWHTSTMLARRAVLGLVGPFDETRRLAEDMEWLTRANAAGVRAGLVDHVALLYRVHEGNTSSDPRAKQQAMLAVLRESVRRQREFGRHGRPA
jgi:glycosyltransferase involved in cell wall biosynthesis